MRSRALWRWLGWLLCAALALQLFFVLRIALLAWWNPQSTAFERSEMWRLSQAPQVTRGWQQHWVDYAHISIHLRRAVLTSEDDTFVHHPGVRWDAIENAWRRNQKLQAHAHQRGSNPPAVLHGGSTITQQLAKNLLLSGERSFLRKGQELLLTHMLELVLSKQRILEIYLNHVEWGEGIFGAEAAARHYFGVSAQQLTPNQAARLAVMLPRPRYYEQHLQSRYLQTRSQAISRRMAATPLP